MLKKTGASSPKGADKIRDPFLVTFGYGQPNNLIVVGATKTPSSVGKKSKCAGDVGGSGVSLDF